MGKRMKLKKSRRARRAAGITLQELDYLRLAHLRDKVKDAVTLGQAEVAQAQGVAQQRVDGAQQAMRDNFNTIAKKYKLDPAQNYAFDDKRQMLIPAEPS